MAITTLCGACNRTPDNPLLGEFDTPYQTPPFDRIRPEHFLPAIEQSVAEARAQTEAIVENPESPTFENTIEALEYSGERLNRVATIFFTLNHAETNDRMQPLAVEIQQRLVEFSNDRNLDPALFARVKAVYDGRDTLDLTGEQRMLLEETYKGFIRSGAGLNQAEKEEYRRLTAELSRLTTEFGQHVLAATNAYSLHIPPSDSARVAGLPAFVREGMAAEAARRGEQGWTVTLQAPSYMPFMTYSTDREARHQLWMAYNSRCNGAGEHDNREITRKIAEIRLRIANLLGYATYADYDLEERMAGSREEVDAFLNELLARTRSHAMQDYHLLQEYARSTGAGAEFVLMPWDFPFYSERYKNEKFAFSEQEAKPYFLLDSVQHSAFLLAERLYGLTFRENRDIPKYHPDVQTYEVYDGTGKFMAVLYMDFFPRTGKRGGAWMTNFREMYRTPDGEEVRPLVSLCTNFTKPTENSPSLLTFMEVTTLLHEFGHCLHGMLAEGTYASLTGTNVYRDFVELPSQLMENWATEKEFLDLWAVHYRTGEKMPEELIRKIVSAKNYLAAYNNVRQVMYGIIDMAWHSIPEPVTEEAEVFEQRVSQPAQVLPYVDGTSMSTAFTHIFDGGYAAGYYSYKWAEVLEADAFSLFRERGIFDRDVAGSFRENVLSKGGTEHPMDLYKRFRGHEPNVEALIDKMGLL